MDECILVLDLYRRLGSSKAIYSETTKSVCDLNDYIYAQTGINRGPKSISNKLDNFKYEETGIHGLKNGGNNTALVWQMYKDASDEELKTIADEVRERLQYANSKDYHAVEKHNFEDATILDDILETSKFGYDKEYVGWVRVNQNIFRSRVLSNFGERCCITGIEGRGLLRASHIKPWKKCNEIDKTAVRNGLCLNPLHDVAFDRGYITLDENYKVVLCSSLEDMVGDYNFETLFGRYEGKRISDSEIPIGLDYLNYHRKYIFKDSKTASR